jgi:hypothetical protein
MLLCMLLLARVCMLLARVCMLLCLADLLLSFGLGSRAR